MVILNVSLLATTADKAVSNVIVAVVPVIEKSVTVLRSPILSAVTADDFNFREDFLKDIDLMLKNKLKDVEAEGFKQFFFD